MLPKILKKFLVKKIHHHVAEKIFVSPIIWHFCTPKSASSFLTRILIELWKQECHQNLALKHWDSPDQTPELFSVYSALFNKKRFYSGHLHTRYHILLKDPFIGPKAKVIVQTRDISDTLVSLRDHLNQEYQKNGSVINPIFLSTGKYWPCLSEENKLMFVTQMFGPWLIDFRNSWETFPNKIVVDYKEVTKDPETTIIKILEYVEIKKSKNEINAAIQKISSEKENIKFNVGKAGRGKSELPPEALSFINTLTNQSHCVTSP